MPKKLPIKLGKEPLVEAVCELRLLTTTGLHSMLPGMLYDKLPNLGVVEQLPAASIPENLRALDPNFAAIPLVRMDWGQFVLLIGSGTIAVASKLPYQGWAVFRQRTLEVFRQVLQSKIVVGVERYSIKYLNLFDSSDIAEQIGLLDWSVKLGNLDLGKSPTMVRVEFPHGDANTVVQVIVGANVKVGTSGVQRQGTVVDVDTICTQSSNDIGAFLNSLEDKLNAIRLQNKNIFFECLKESTIATLEPVYE